MGLFSKKPSIPPITDEEGVIDWMLKYDDKLEEDRKKLTHEGMKAVKHEVLTVLKNSTDSESLKKDVENKSNFYFTILLPHLAQTAEAGGPVPDDEDEYCKVLNHEAILDSVA